MSNIALTVMTMIISKDNHVESTKYSSSPIENINDKQMEISVRRDERVVSTSIKMCLERQTATYWNDKHEHWKKV